MGDLGAQSKGAWLGERNARYASEKNLAVVPQGGNTGGE